MELSLGTARSSGGRRPRTFTGLDGRVTPVFEAKHAISVQVYKSDRKLAIQNDPCKCLLALGIRRNKNVLDVHIGSGGNAWVTWKADGNPFTEHYVIRVAARREIDKFDSDRRAATMKIELDRPSLSQTAIYRERLNAKRDRAGESKKKREQAAAGAEPKKRASRLMRLGLSRRRFPKVSKSGDVDMNDNED